MKIYGMVSEINKTEKKYEKYTFESQWTNEEVQRFI
jgi:hypothetical protein